MITESRVVFPAQKQAVQSDAKSAENTGKTKKTSEKTPVQTPDETADGASATASENPQLTRYLTQEYGKDWAQTVTPEQLQKAKYQLGLAVTDDPALNTPLYNNLTPDAVQELKREYGRRWWDKATEEDVLIVQQASLAGKAQLIGDAAQGNLDADAKVTVEDSVETLTGSKHESGTKTIKELILESSAVQKWGVSENGTNQGIKHFIDYWERYPNRIFSIEQRVGVPKGEFSNSVDGFNRFTMHAERIINKAINIGNVRDINGKIIYYVDGVTVPQKGVVVVMHNGKIQSLMPSDLKTFNKMQ